jgi:hypothetical protein
MDPALPAPIPENPQPHDDSSPGGDNPGPRRRSRAGRTNFRLPSAAEIQWRLLELNGMVAMGVITPAITPWPRLTW